MKNEQQGHIRVLVVDDHPLIRDGLRLFLQATPDIRVIAEAGDGELALQLAFELSPDVIILDMELPKLSGIEVAKQVLDKMQGVHILAFSGHDDFQFILEVVKMGISGYLTKDETPERILEAIRSICQDEPGWYSARVAERLSRFYRFEKHLGLTDREMEVFRGIAHGKTNEEIANDLGISNKTVEKHVEKLFQKLGVFSRTEAAVRGVLAGLI
jgi:DNA-binding NarL/FixJ family response regulator